MADSDALWMNRAPSAGNLLYGDNTDFDGGIGTWAANVNATVAPTTAQAHTGPGALALTAVAAANASARHVAGAGTNGIPVTAGEQYSAEAWFRAGAAARDVQVGVNWYDAAASLVSTTMGVAIPDSTTGWVQALFAGSAPATAAFAVVICQVVGPAAGEVHYVDDVEFTAAVTPSMTAEELRRALATLMFPGVADRFGARAGVRPGGVDAVTLAGTTWTVQNVNATAYPGLSSLDGPYLVQHQSESGQLAAADPTQDRVDAIDMQVQDDDEDSSGFRRFRPVYVQGVPGAGAPALTGQSFRAATFLVPSGGTPAPSVTYVAPYTVALGGILPVRDASERPTAGLYDGMALWRQDVKALEVRDEDAGAWPVAASGKGFQFWQRIVYAASGSFVKASFPGLRAVDVQVWGGGASGGGAAATAAFEASEGAGGGSGGYTRKWILAGALLTSETVTVGFGGAASAAGGAGNNGGQSSLGGHCLATGGVGGSAGVAAGGFSIVDGGDGGSGSGGDINAVGGSGGNGTIWPTSATNAESLRQNFGGAAPLGGGNATSGAAGTAGQGGRSPGGGSTGARNNDNSVARSSAAAADGLIVVDLYV